MERGMNRSACWLVGVVHTGVGGINEARAVTSGMLRVDVAYAALFRGRIIKAVVRNVIREQADPAT